MTNDDTVRSTVVDIADDGLDVDRTLEVMATLRRQRQRRRQVVSLLSAAAVVVIVVLLIGTSFGGFASPHPVQPAPLPETTSAVSTQAVSRPTYPTSKPTSATSGSSLTKPAAPATLVRYTMEKVVSPVTSSLGSTDEWHLEPGRLWQAAQSVGSVITPTSQPDQSRGFVITSTPTLPLTQRTTGRSVVAATTAAVVGGHPAELNTAPAGTVDSQGYPAQKRLSWTLPDGRFIHVFDTDPAPATGNLQQFANSIRNVALPLKTRLSVGWTLPGYRLAFADTNFNGESISLCPAGTNSDLSRCLTLATDLTSADTTLTGEGNSKSVSNGTVYLSSSKRRAELFPDDPGGPVIIISPVPLSNAQFLSIAESVKLT